MKVTQLSVLKYDIQIFTPVSNKGSLFYRKLGIKAQGLLPWSGVHSKQAVH